MWQKSTISLQNGTWRLSLVRNTNKSLWKLQLFWMKIGTTHLSIAFLWIEIQLVLYNSVKLCHETKSVAVISFWNQLGYQCSPQLYTRATGPWCFKTFPICFEIKTIFFYFINNYLLKLFSISYTLSIYIWYRKLCREVLI